MSCEVEKQVLSLSAEVSEPRMVLLGDGDQILRTIALERGIF